MSTLVTLSIAAFLIALSACSKSSNFKGDSEGAPAAKAQNETVGADKGTSKDSSFDTATILDSRGDTKIGVETQTVEFGTNGVFHIGDGQLQDSSCREEVETIELSGKIYYFSFEVLSENTKVNIGIEKLCGTDYPNSNTYELVLDENEAVPLFKQKVPVTALSTEDVILTMPPQTLARGKYSIRVESLQDIAINHVDFDDFLIGKIKVKADKAIKSLGVRTE